MINCVAIDDEPIALSILQEYCQRMPDVSLTCFTSPIAGMEYIHQHCPHIVFLDIEMNSYNGMALARHLPKNCCLIFTTAYARYALEGFEADAVDFLHKPIFFPRFAKAIEKANRWLDLKSDIAHSGTITLKSEHKNVIIALQDIVFIEAMDNYVRVVRRGIPVVMSLITMKEMEKILPRDMFLRVHRSYIVSLEAIDCFSNRNIYIKGLEFPIPVGRKYINQFNYIYNTFKSIQK